MAKNTLPEDFKDDILAESMNGRRRYQMISNADGTVSFVDVTEYSQVGSNFGQAQINATNVAVNESADKNKIIDSKEDLLANTQAGMMAGALAVKEIRSELNEKMDADKIIIGTSLINFNSGIGYLPYNHYPEYEKEPICIAMMVGKQRYGMTVVPSNYKDGRIELYTNAAINGNLYVSYFIGLRK